MTEMTRHARTELLRHAGYRVLEAETQVKADGPGRRRAFRADAGVWE